MVGWGFELPLNWEIIKGGDSVKQIGILAVAGAAVLLGGHAAGASIVAESFTTEPGSYTVAARMLFDYQVSAGDLVVKDIDVVNVWQMVVSKNPNGGSHVVFTSTPQDSPAMQEGPLSGYQATLNFSLDQLGRDFFIGNGGVLSFSPPNDEAEIVSSEMFNTFWNGKFDAEGVYVISQPFDSNFYSWTAHDIVIFMDPGDYSLETGLFWKEYSAMGEDGNPNNNINFTIAAASPVPAPTSVLLIGYGLLGLLGLRRQVAS